MIFSTAEIEALRLAAWCKDLPADSAERILAESTGTLTALGLLRKSRSGLSYRLTPSGYEILDKAEIPCQRDQSYLGKGSALTRRLRTTEIILLLYRVFGDIFWRGADREISYLPSFTFRRKNAANLLGGARLAGFLYTPEVTYVPYYLSIDSDGIYPMAEERTMLGSGLRRGREIRVIYTGKGDLSDLITAASGPEQKKQKSTTTSFWDSMDVFTCPVCFVPLSDEGARQLRIMCRADYERILARHLLGDAYRPAVDRRFHALHGGTGDPFLIGVGCNLKSFGMAASAGERPVHIILLEHQLPAVRKYLAGKNTILHTITAQDAEAALHLPRPLHIPDASPCRIPGGGYIHAPAFPNHRKSGEENHLRIPEA